MNESQLKLMVRTPGEVVLEVDVSSIRVPTETGQVGVRRRAEPLVLAVEPGLVLVRRDDTYKFVGTAGGLLRCDGAIASLLTPLAVTGDDEDAVIDALEEALAQPSAEMEARATLGRLQSSILRELREGRMEQTRRVEGAP
jgi:F0F1-type ATP synthase epsilon subunit